MAHKDFPKNALVDESYFDGKKLESAKLWSKEEKRYNWQIVETAEFKRFLAEMEAHNTVVLAKNPSAKVATIRKSAFDDMTLDELNNELFG